MKPPTRRGVSPGKGLSSGGVRWATAPCAYAGSYIAAQVAAKAKASAPLHRRILVTITSARVTAVPLAATEIGQETRRKAYMVSIRRAKRLRDRLPIGLALSALVLTPALAAGEPTAPGAEDELAKTIVEKADHVRFPVDSFEVSVTI